MLLAIDVGNTNIAVGVYAGDELRYHWRLQTEPRRTSDEYWILLTQLFVAVGMDAAAVRAVIVSSVVPPLTGTFERVTEDHFGCKPLLVGPGVRTGMKILSDNPREVGADRIVNAVAAYERCKDACIVVDFGTATTFDVISPAGEYLGGAIAPGIGISTEALFRAASKLPRVEIVQPASTIGHNTIHAMQAGIVFGYVALVDGMVDRIRTEIEYPTTIISTGGLAPLIAAESRTIDIIDELLTLTGLQIIYARNEER